MSKRLFVAAIVVVLGCSTQARAFHPFHPCTGYYHFRASGPTTGGVPTGGAVPHGVSSFGVLPGVSSFGVLPGVSSFGVLPGVTSFGVVPHVLVGSSSGTSQGISSFGTVIQNPGTGSPTGTAGANADDIAAKVKNALKADIDAIKANQAIILEDLKQLRIKQGIPRPETQPKIIQNPGMGFVPTAPSANPPVVAAIERDLSDIAALQKQLAEKEAKRIAARKQATGGNTIAVNR